MLMQATSPTLIELQASVYIYRLLHVIQLASIASQRRASLIGSQGWSQEAPVCVRGSLVAGACKHMSVAVTPRPTYLPLPFPYSAHVEQCDLQWRRPTTGGLRQPVQQQQQVGRLAWERRDEPL